MDNSATVNFTDILLICLGFQGIFDNASLYGCDIDPEEPNAKANFADIHQCLRAFQELPYPFGSPCDGGARAAAAPAAPPSQPVAEPVTLPKITLVPLTRTVRPGGLVKVDVFVSGVSDLAGFQFAADVSAGDKKNLSLEDIRIDGARRDFALGSHGCITAVDKAGGRGGSVSMIGPVNIPGQAYLGTFAYRVSTDLQDGSFSVSLRPDATFLLNSKAEQINCVKTATMRIAVEVRVEREAEPVERTRP